MTRISSGYIINQALNSVQSSLGKMTQLQAQISSGKKIQAPSDDPIGMTQSLRLKEDVNFSDRFMSNSTEALSEMQVAENSIGQVVDQTQRARELAIQAANGTLSQSQLNSIKVEVDAILKTVTQLGNTNYNGRYVFAGFKTDTPPFAESGTDINYTGSSNVTAAGYERRLQISQTDTIPVNLNGQDLLGSVTVTGAQTTTGSGLLQTLKQLSLDLAAGDTTSISQRLGTLGTDLDSVVGYQTIIGARTNQLDNLQQRLQENRVTQSDFISRIEDTDMADAISKLTFQQNLYQASLSGMSKILSTSLMDFLR